VSILLAILFLLAVTTIVFIIVWGVCLLGDTHDKTERYVQDNRYISDQQYLEMGGKIKYHFYGKTRE
jgi:hypothetical protein